MIESVFQLRSDLHPSLVGSAIWFVIFLLIGLIKKFAPRSSFSLLLESFYETVYSFFGDTLPWKQNEWIVQYVTVLFFIILIYNVAALVFDPVASVMGMDAETGAFSLAEFVTIATGDIHFNAAMATISILIMIYAQWWAAKTTKTWFMGTVDKIGKTIYEYLPIFWKWLVTFDQWEMSNVLYAPIWLAVKLFDIVISLFIWLLDIIGLWAKVLSLAARLFGNMIAWGTLTTLLITWWWAALAFLIWWAVPYDQASFPFLIPIIIYAQGLLVAVIQAFVFPLLVAIFVKVAQWDDEEESLWDVVAEYVEEWFDAIVGQDSHAAG